MPNEQHNHKNSKERLSEYAESAKYQAQEKTKDSAAELESQVKNAQDQLNKLTQEIDQRMRENPWPIVIGVGVGCLILGALLGSRRND